MGLSEQDLAGIPKDKPCRECPWRRHSAPGWLGGELTARDWIQVANSDQVVPCHLTAGDSDRQCVGMAIYRANVSKSPRDPEALRMPPDRAKVFGRHVMNDRLVEEFVVHHEQNAGPVDAAEIQALPLPANRAEYAKLPRWAKYRDGVGGRVLVKQREGDRTIGDAIFRSVAEADDYIRIECRREADRAEAVARHEAQLEAEAQAEVDLVASYRGFDSDSPMRFGRSRKTLERYVRYEGRMMTRKQLVELKVGYGWRVTGRGLEEPVSEVFLGSDALTKTGLRYAEHLIGLEGDTHDAIQECES